MGDAKPDKLVGALVAGLRIVRFLRDQRDPIGVNRIARDLGMNPSTCFNLLRTLVHERLVVFDPASKTYSLGLGLVDLAKGALERVSYARLVRPYLDRIAAGHNVTATLWQRSGSDRVVLVDYAESRNAIRLHMPVGQRLPWNIAALGRCLVAYSRLDRDALEAEFNLLRWQSPISFESYMDEVAEARRDGYAVDVETYVKGVTTVSAPVLQGDRAIMAISAVGFSAQLGRTQLRRLAETMRDIAREVTAVIAGQTDSVREGGAGQR